MTLEFSAPRRTMDKAVDVLAEVLHEPLFPDNLWQREVKRQQSILKERLSSPVKCGFDLASQMLYGEHPYAGNGYGTEAGIEKISADAGRKYFSQMC